MDIIFKYELTFVAMQTQNRHKQVPILTLHFTYALMFSELGHTA